MSRELEDEARGGNPVMAQPRRTLALLGLLGILITMGSFAAELTKEVATKFFFLAQGTENPAGNVPNWYYYWTDELVNGPHTYVAGLSYRGLTTCGNRAIQISIGPNAYTSTGLLDHPTEKYIDAFGIVVSHEQWHRSHFTHNLTAHIAEPNCKLSELEDSDGDFLCDRESGDPPGHNGGYEKFFGTDPFNPFTFGMPDAEWIAHQHDTDPNASSSDWAHPGSPTASRYGCGRPKRA